MKSKKLLPFVIATWLLVVLLAGLNNVQADSSVPEVEESEAGERAEVGEQPINDVVGNRQGAYVAWDESVDGGLSNWPLTPTVVSFQGGLNLVIGTIGEAGGTAGGEGYDVWTFNVPPGASMPGITLTNYVVTGGNTSTGFNFYGGAQGEGGPLLESIPMAVGDVNVTNLIDTIAPLTPGDYSVSLREFSAPGQIYELTFDLRLPNIAPVATADMYTTTEDVVLTVSALGVLANDVDADSVHLYSVSSNGDDLLREIDPLTGATMNSIQLTHAGGITVQSGTGLATHPLTGELYGVLKLAGQSGRELVTINPATGVATSIGDTGDAFAGITFDDMGTLYGVTGDGASVSETLFTLDTTTAISTMVTPLGNGDDGETIGFNPDDGLIYHASGHNTPCPPGDLSDCVIFETVARTAPYTITNIPIFSNGFV